MDPKVYMWADILENMTWKEREHGMEEYIFFKCIRNKNRMYRILR